MYKNMALFSGGADSKSLLSAQQPNKTTILPFNISQISSDNSLLNRVQVKPFFIV